MSFINTICNETKKTYADITNTNAEYKNNIQDQNKAIINLTSELEKLKNQTKKVEKENTYLKEQITNYKKESGSIIKEKITKHSCHLMITK